MKEILYFSYTQDKLLHVWTALKVNQKEASMLSDIFLKYIQT